MIEVELKAHVDNPESVESRIAYFAKFLRRVDKRDSYWHGPGWQAHRGTRGFRVRSEGDTYVVTFKQKQITDGMEVNREREFEISDPDSFQEFVQRLGCEPYYKKHKAGAAYEYNGITLEVLTIEGLGSFLEVERLVATDAKEEIDRARNEVRSALALAGVPESAIEARTYSEMIVGFRGSE